MSGPPLKPPAPILVLIAPTHTRARAATNLSALYLLEGELEAAAGYTDLALRTDRWAGNGHSGMEGGRNAGCGLQKQGVASRRLQGVQRTAG
jgi:hypothetical protein